MPYCNGIAIAGEIDIFAMRPGKSAGTAGRDGGKEHDFATFTP
jgi:hypothetical protein